MVRWDRNSHLRCKSGPIKRPERDSRDVTVVGCGCPFRPTGSRGGSSARVASEVALQPAASKAPVADLDVGLRPMGLTRDQRQNRVTAPKLKADLQGLSQEAFNPGPCSPALLWSRHETRYGSVMSLLRQRFVGAGRAPLAMSSDRLCRSGTMPGFFSVVSSGSNYRSRSKT